MLTKLLDKSFAKISILVLIITIIGFILSEILFYLKLPDIELSIVALLGAGLLYSLTKQRKGIFSSVDYPTLIFFISMFIVTFSLWHSDAITNLIQIFPNPNPNDVVQRSAIITLSSLGFSHY